MRSVTYTAILNDVLRKWRRNPADSDISTNDKECVDQEVNNALLEFWNWADWPELITNEQRPFRRVWNAATTYAVGDEVYDATGDAYYICILEALNKAPSTETTYWTEIESADLDRYLPWEPGDRAPLGTVLKITQQSDVEDNDSVSGYGFILDSSGVWVQNCSLNQVWVRHRLEPPTVTYVAYSAEGTYSEGDVALFSTGHVKQYRYNTAGTLAWVETPIPAFLRAAITIGAYSGLLAIDRREEESQVYYGRALANLVNMASIQIDQQGQTQGAKVKVWR